MKHLLYSIILMGFLLSCGTENKQTFKVTTTVSPTEGGTITLSPTGGVYSGGETVTITGTPSTGWRFVRWEGDWSGETNPSTLNMTKDYSVIGIFIKRDYPLTINVEGEGTVVERVIPQKTTQYPYQTVVELTPVPDNGWRFVQWSGDLSGSEVPKTITVDGEKTVNVKFERINYPLTITVVGEGTVTETIVPQKTTEYPYETVVELTPVPSEGWEFVEWGGDLTGSEVPKQITVDRAKNVTVTFQRKNYPLTITIVGEGTVVERIIPQKTTDYPFQTVVELTPVPSEGWRFTQWNGDLSGTTVPLSVTVSKETNVTVTFTRIAYLNQNGITIMCPDGKVGEIGIVDGVQYEVVDRNLLNQRRDEGKDLTKVCTSLITNMSGLFSGKSFNQPIGNWDVSNVTDMGGMFNETPFNQPIGNWDVSKVTNMRLMFRSSSFNRPIGDWNVSNVTTMYEMFQFGSFNQPIGNWDVSNVTDMRYTFDGTPFNQPIGDWNVSNVRSMSYMFRNTSFNQPIGDWNVSNVTSMELMFNNTPFNQPIGDWNVSNVTSMELMFDNTPFNQTIGNWNVSSVTNTHRMFDGSSFNQPIGNWNVSSVRNMAQMFRNSPFNQPIGDWDVSNVRDMGGMFNNSSFNQPIGNWNVSSVRNMGEMFSNSSFNQPIGNWDVSNVTDMIALFRNSSFNQPIGNWDVSSARNMAAMFDNTPFNQPIGDWDVSSVTEMWWMFQTSSFNQPLANWDVSSVRNMDGMFDRSRQFNRDISDWCVSQIPNKPALFDRDTPQWVLPQPIWGTCPTR